jgi:hypothetical protein
MPDESSVEATSSLFINTGKMESNPDLKDMPIGMSSPEFKCNEFIVYEEAMTRMKYLVLCRMI